MRNDLPSMGCGRAAAQASHAANALMYHFGENEIVKKWASQTHQGFGTAIVLSASKKQIEDIWKMDTISDYNIKETVIDPDYVISIPSEIMPCIDDRRLDKFEQSPSDPTKYLYHRSEVTCAFILGDKDWLKEYLGNLPLYS